MAGENSNDDLSKISNDDVSRIYETLKSPTFLRDMYWEILSTMKEKNTYKNIRTALDRLLNQSNQSLETVTNLDDSERDEARKVLVCQICSLSYAVDTVFSKIAFLTMEKACKALIPPIVQELKSEGKVPNDILSKLSSIIASKEKQGLSETSKLTNSLSETSNLTNSLSETSNLTNSLEEDKADTVSPQKRKLIETSPVKSNKKVCENDINGNLNKANSIGMNASKKKLGGRIKKLPQKSKLDTSSCSKESTEEKASTSSSPMLANASTTDMPQDSSQIDENGVDSDAESDISFGRLSPVSSVHTSDLSSFDDEISVSSGDEGDVLEGKRKKRMSLKELERRFSMSRESSLHAKQDSKKSKSPMPEKTPEKKTPEKNTAEKKNTQKKISRGVASNKITETVDSPSSNEKELSKRARKPNSKYSSDSVFCPVIKVKERKKSSAAAKETDKSNSSEDLSPKKNSNKIVNHSVVKKESDGTQEMNIEQKNNDSNMKSPAKECDSSDLFKPQASGRSLTSRRTAPLTLFST